MTQPHPDKETTTMLEEKNKGKQKAAGGASNSPKGKKRKTSAGSDSDSDYTPTSPTSPAPTATRRSSARIRRATTTDSPPAAEGNVGQHAAESSTAADTPRRDAENHERSTTSPAPEPIILKLPRLGSATRRNSMAANATATGSRVGEAVATSWTSTDVEMDGSGADEATGTNTTSAPEVTDNTTPPGAAVETKKKKAANNNKKRERDAQQLAEAEAARQSAAAEQGEGAAPPAEPAGDGQGMKEPTVSEAGSSGTPRPPAKKRKTNKKGAGTPTGSDEGERQEPGDATGTTEDPQPLSEEEFACLMLVLYSGARFAPPEGTLVPFLIEKGLWKEVQDAPEWDGPHIPLSPPPSPHLPGADLDLSNVPDSSLNEEAPAAPAPAAPLRRTRSATVAATAAAASATANGGPSQPISGGHGTTQVWSRESVAAAAIAAAAPKPSAPKPSIPKPSVPKPSRSTARGPNKPSGSSAGEETTILGPSSTPGVGETGVLPNTSTSRAVPNGVPALSVSRFAPEGSILHYIDSGAGAAVAASAYGGNGVTNDAPAASVSPASAEAATEAVMDSLEAQMDLDDIFDYPAYTA
ncbi:hypothetical protein Q8F55_003393 [Vanrija albida]|uniref:Uncharacterized protein n=1 Tax=Vanrija albida TaxID=181172 RepID=A0ABR3Q3S3_9TREE